jgi:hypothetical protein
MADQWVGRWMIFYLCIGNAARGDGGMYSIDVMGGVG